MRWGLVLVLCAGCHLVIDPDEHVNDSVDATVDVGGDADNEDAGEEDAGLPDASDVGVDCDPPTAVPMAPACCIVDEDCPTPMMGPALVCHGGGTCGGPAGVCFPDPVGSGNTGEACFLDVDCVSGRCVGGPNCGCTVSCGEMMLPPGECE